MMVIQVGITNDSAPGAYHSNQDPQQSGHPPQVSTMLGYG